MPVNEISITLHPINKHAVAVVTHKNLTLKNLGSLSAHMSAHKAMHIHKVQRALTSVRVLGSERMGHTTVPSPRNIMSRFLFQKIMDRPSSTASKAGR